MWKFALERGSELWFSVVHRHFHSRRLACHCQVMSPLLRPLRSDMPWSHCSEWSTWSNPEIKPRTRAKAILKKAILQCQVSLGANQYPLLFRRSTLVVAALPPSRCLLRKYNAKQQKCDLSSSSGVVICHRPDRSSCWSLQSWWSKALILQLNREGKNKVSANVLAIFFVPFLTLFFQLFMGILTATKRLELEKSPRIHSSELQKHSAITHAKRGI